MAPSGPRSFATVVEPSRVSSAEADRARFGGLGPREVVWPHGAAEVRELLAEADRQRTKIAVVGAGTRALRQWEDATAGDCIALVTTEMRDILRLDRSAGLVHAQAGIRLGELEAELTRHDLTLGPHLRGVSDATLGGLLADPPAEAHSPRYGTLGDSCFALCALTPAGSSIQTRPAPRAAAGPHLGRMLLNSKGALGVITSATLRAHRRPQSERYCAFAFAGALAALATAREVIVSGLRPTALHVSLNEQARRRFVEPAPGPAAASTLVVALAGPDALVEQQQRFVEQLAQPNAGTSLELPTGESWWSKRESASLAQRTCVALRYSQLTALLDTIAPEPRACCWVEQFTHHGATLWVGFDDARAEPSVATRSLLAGAAPAPSSDGHRTREQLRRALDPRDVMAVPPLVSMSTEARHDD